MPKYYVEGFYVNKQARKKARRTGEIQPDSIEPYAKTIWASSLKEAYQIATAELEGGEWIEEPHVGQITEEQRMRSQGAPEFPSLLDSKRKSQKR